MKTCPHCKLSHFEISQRCECGFNFITSTFEPAATTYRQSKHHQPNQYKPMMAFLIAPMAGPLGASFGYIIIDAIFSSPPNQSSAFMYLAITLGLYWLATPIIYIFSILLGIPLYLFLKCIRSINKSSILIGWSLVGTLSSIILFSNKWVQANKTDISSVSATVFPYALGGLFIGFLFWEIISRTMEEKSAKP